MRFHLNATTFARLTYFIIVIIIALLLLISCIFLLSQAVRTAPNRNWAHNFNALIIGAAYVLVLVASLLLCLKRRLSVRLQLTRIPKRRIAVGKGDVPKLVHVFIEEELLRSSAIFHASLPKVSHREGWGSPGTLYEVRVTACSYVNSSTGTRWEDIRFRTTVLDLVPRVDTAARTVIPSMPPLSPHVSLVHHLRHINPLLSAETRGQIYFHTFTNAVEKARYAEAEMTQPEFESAFEAGCALEGILLTYQRMLKERQGTIQ
ncbi:uncharacterized protein FOMMEDRAFT_166397 [Fomitiporia mediterranea MF3/22]|uniref:uncharacterized protein n=1 Tax=Fomitiporia mediterranea (strain MF3/22) TaxID=694068 RepID=UPI000440836F|nr:uncharacterized protein FOMMEDRAFT_166397 [Fomitiporia mediterranea MF3/22]EJD06130.1 hypothetical protein FOMMEDRAFT_166397 [Fomitiporia mediterranea MF3/22]